MLVDRPRQSRGVSRSRGATIGALHSKPGPKLGVRDVQGPDCRQRLRVRRLRHIFDFASAASRCSECWATRPPPSHAVARQAAAITWLRSLQGLACGLLAGDRRRPRFTLETLGLADAGVRDRLMGLYRALDCFPEVRECCGRPEGCGLRDGDPLQRLAVDACRRGRRRQARWPPRSCVVGRGGRRVQDPPARLPAGGGSARLRRPAPSPSNPPTPGTRTRPRPSACAWCGATATASVASACRAPRTARSARWPSSPPSSSAREPAPKSFPRERSASAEIQLKTRR